MNGRDRMVVAMGLSLLLITGMGIFLYPDETELDKPEDTKATTYTIIWSRSIDTVTENAFVGRDGWQREYTLQMGDGAVVDSVTVSLDWHEAFNPHGLFLPWNWSDKIEASLVIDSLQFSRTAPGYGKIHLTATNNEQQETPFETTNKEEVDSWVQSQTTNELSCLIDLSITPKPWPFDSGNDFTLRITCQYSIPYVTTT